MTAVLHVLPSPRCATASAGPASPAVLAAALHCQEMAAGAPLLCTHKVCRVNSKRGKAVTSPSLFLETFLEELSSLLPGRFHQVMCRHRCLVHLFVPSCTERCHWGLQDSPQEKPKGSSGDAQESSAPKAFVRNFHERRNSSSF